MTDRAGILARLATMVGAATTEQHLADRLALASRELLNADGVSITLETATTSRILLSTTDRTAERLEQLQDVLNQGPTWDAYRSSAAVVTQLDSEADQRWAQFAPAARKAVGPRTIIALPMRPSSSVLGVLSLHLQLGKALPDGLESAQFLADTLGAALLRDPDAYIEPDGAGPWSGRAHIHQATGMVISQLGLTPDDALAMLRAHAYAHETTLDAISYQVLDRSLDFGKDLE